MTKYYPTSQLLGSTAEPPALGFYELAKLHQLSNTLPACTSLAIIQSTDAAMRRVYLKHPTQENWLALERGGFFATESDFGFVMDALH